MTTEIFQPAFITEAAADTLANMLLDSKDGNVYEDQAQALYMHECFADFLYLQAKDRLPESLICHEMSFDIAASNDERSKEWSNQYGRTIQPQAHNIASMGDALLTSEVAFLKGLANGNISPQLLETNQVALARILTCNSMTPDHAARATQLKNDCAALDKASSSREKTSEPTKLVICSLIGRIIRNVNTVAKHCAETKPNAFWLALVYSSVPIRLSISYIDKGDSKKKKYSYVVFTPMMSSKYLSMFMSMSRSDTDALVQTHLYALEETWNKKSRSYGIITDPTYLMDVYRRGAESKATAFLDVIQAHNGAVSVGDRRIKRKNLKFNKT